MAERHKHIWLPQPCTALPAAPQCCQGLNAISPAGLCPPARTDVLGAGVAVLGVQGLEAAAAVGPPILHDVTLPPQNCLTLEAAEMLHVPVPPFSLSALVGKNDLGEETQAWSRAGQKRDPGCRQPIFVSPAHAPLFMQPPNFTANSPSPAWETPIVRFVQGTHHFLGKSKFLRSTLVPRLQSVKAELQ